MQAIILAGGLGTRLEEVVKHQPKVLATINEKPFLYWLVLHLQKKGIADFIFSLGYLHEQVEEFLQTEFPDISKNIVVEDKPLDTGGAIKKCLLQTNSKEVVVINGDTFFNLNFEAFIQYHHTTDADCTLALKPMKKIS